MQSPPSGPRRSSNVALVSDAPPLSSVPPVSATTTTGSGTWRQGGLGSLDEDMEKLFEPPESFSISDVISSTGDVQPSRHNRYDENDYQLHRGESFPHIHHPLKSIHSRSMRRRSSRTSESDADSICLKESRSSSVQTTSSYPNFSQLDGIQPTLKALAKDEEQNAAAVKDGDGEQTNSSSDKEDSATDVVETSPLLSMETASQSPPTISSPKTASSVHSLLSDLSPDVIKGRVKFEVGAEDPDELENSDEKHRHRRHKQSRHHHRKHIKEEDPTERQCSGKESIKTDGLQKVPTEPDEAMLLQQGDLDEMTSHRFEDVRGIRRHKIQTKSVVSSFIHVGNNEGNIKQLKTLPVSKKTFDRSPHEVFVELDELYKGDVDLEWKETARWIKYEEDLEEGANRWGKPHVGPLSFHSLLTLRKCLEQGTVLLDLEERELPGIAYRVVEHMVINDQIKPEDKGAVMRALLLRHKHVNDHRQFQFGLKRNLSAYSSLMSLNDEKPKPQKSVSFSMPSNENGNGDFQSFKSPKLKSKTDPDFEKDLSIPQSIDENVSIDMKETDSLQASSQDDLRRPFDMSIMKKIPYGAEATTVLVGGVDFLEQPTIAFVRLAEGTVLPTLLEVPVPVRFMFILLGPIKSELDYHEVGRSISTLMSNRTFHEAAYKADHRKDLMSAINEFLDDSIVLPPGDWHDKSLFPIHEIQRKTEEINLRKRKDKEKIALLTGEDRKKAVDDPLRRTKKCFGGLISDVKRRYPFYLSDFTDAFNVQCVSATIFIYFAALSGAISFGGILSSKTHNMIGVSETLVMTSVCGVIFSLFAAQPLMIIGVSGPVLLFDESLYNFCQSYGIEYLPLRIWVGIWLTVIALAVVAAEGSFLLRYFTRFTEDILSALISIIYIYESMVKLVEVFQEHPLQTIYCMVENDTTYNYTISKPNNTYFNTGGSIMSQIPTNNLMMEYSRSLISTSDYNMVAQANPNGSMDSSVTSGLSNSLNSTASNYSDIFNFVSKGTMNSIKNQPNTALLTMILMLGTFFIAYFLRQFRNSQYLGRTARRALGDFGVPIALAIMVSLDYCVQDTYTEKLSVPQGLTPSDPSVRGWVISPMGIEQRIPMWHIFAAFLPAMLFFILIFMEVQICELILAKNERMLHKGSGFHLDILLMCVLNLGSSVLGGPWMSAAIVRAIAHVMSLTVMSRTHAPGEKPHIFEVKDQRVTNLLVSVLVGLSVLMTKLLRLIPVSVLFGIFIYMGVVSMSGVQLFERLRLFLMPVKHHPQVAYVQRVQTWRMHLFTIVQLFCIAVLWAVKSTVIAIALPFVLLMMIPLRSQLNLIFTDEELRALDCTESEVRDLTDEPDFYEEAPIPG